MKRILHAVMLGVLAGAAGFLPARSDALPDGPRENDAMTVIAGGILIDVESGTTVPDSIVLIKGDRIKEVGHAGTVAIPPQAKVIDAHGKWIIPGLADMHVHLDAYGYQIPEIFLKYGVTTVRDCGGDVTLLRLLREHIDSGKASGPRIFFAGMILDGDPPVWPSSITLLADTPARAESIIDFLSDQGVDAIKVYNGISEATLAKIVEVTHRRHLPVIGHVPRAITLTRAVEMGMDDLEHIRITAREILPAEEAARAKEIDVLPVGVREPRIWSHIDLESKQIKEIIELLVRRHVYLDPTLTVDEGLYVDGLQVMKDDPNNELLPKAILDKLMKEATPAIFVLPDEIKAVAVQSFRKRQQFVGMCYHAGVRLLAGTDSFGLGKQILGLSLHHELQLLVESGLSPLDALRASTITAARALRREDDLGSIKPGKLADLVLLNADPLNDISNTQKIHLVVKNGRVFEFSGWKTAPGSK